MSNWIITIVNLILLAILSATCKIYLIRADHWNRLMNQGGLFKTMIWLFNLLLIVTGLGAFYRIFSSGGGLNVLIAIMLLLPQVVIRKSPTNTVARKIDKYILKRYREHYLACPYGCGSKIFFKNIVESKFNSEFQGIAYYFLLDRDDNIVPLGFLEDENHPAALFLFDERPFEVLVATYSELLGQKYRKIVTLNHKSEILEDGVRCVKCKSQFDEQRL